MVSRWSATRASIAADRKVAPAMSAAARWARNAAMVREVATQFGLIAPCAEQHRASADENGQWKGDQQQPETDAHASGIPRDNRLRAARRLIPERLEIADEKRGHE